MSPDITPTIPDNDSVPDENSLWDKDALIIHRFSLILPRRLLMDNLKYRNDDRYKEWYYSNELSQ